MTDYRLFGADTSPYSLKVRAFLRYKTATFEWITPSRANEAAFREAAKVATVPLLISPNRPPSQDSSAILDALEQDIDHRARAAAAVVDKVLGLGQTKDMRTNGTQP